MAKIEDLISKKPSNNNQTNGSVTMDGSFSCQTCNDISNEAQFDKNAGLIVWTCSNNHESKVVLG